MELHRIGDDLSEHAWYEELFVRTIADAEAFAARWAAFEEYVTAHGEGPPTGTPTPPSPS
jgi:hypothetical protein